MGLGLRIVVDQHADRSDGGVEISFFFLVIMWWLFLVDVTVVGGFWRLKFCLFSLCGGCFMWLWLWLVVDLVI